MKNKKTLPLCFNFQDQAFFLGMLWQLRSVCEVSFLLLFPGPCLDFATCTSFNSGPCVIISSISVVALKLDLGKNDGMCANYGIMSDNNDGITWE